MKCSLVISNFLEEISSLSHSIVFLYFFALITEEGTSPVAQLVKNLPAVPETWVQSLGLEDPLEKGKATHSSVLAWRMPWTVSHGVTKSWKDHHQMISKYRMEAHIGSA